MSDVAYIELPFSKKGGHVCEVLVVTPDQAAITYSMELEQHLLHHVCNQSGDLCGLGYTILPSSAVSLHV